MQRQRYDVRNRCALRLHSAAVSQPRFNDRYRLVSAQSPASSEPTVPNLGTNAASVGLGRFTVAASVALAWLVFSWWLSLPWAAELGALIGSLPAWLLIGGIALAPGFMNAFQSTCLLLRPRGRYVEPAGYPAVTILVAAYNEAANIATTLRSIARQRYPAQIEVIVVDDGSVDGTADEVRAHGQPDVRLIVRRQNGGKAAALNDGLAMASRELLITVDADCWL